MFLSAISWGRGPGAARWRVSLCKKNPLHQPAAGSPPQQKLGRIVAALLAFALPSSALAQATHCIARDQAAALVTLALPTLVERVADRCRASLPPNAYLIANAQALADRYRPDAAAAWPQARGAIGAIFQQFLGQPMPPEMNADMLRMLAEPALGELLARRIGTGDCATVDAAVASAASLSGRDLGRLAAIAATVADRKGAGIAGVLAICRPEEKPR